MFHLKSFTLLFFILFFAAASWNCGQQESINSIPQVATNPMIDGSGATFSVTITFKIFQLYTSQSCGNTEYKIFDTTQTFSIPLWPYPSATCHTLKYINDRNACGEYTVGWRVEKYVTWTDSGPNHSAFWTTPSGTYIKELQPESGGPYSWSQSNTYTDWSYNSNINLQWGISGWSDDEKK